MHCLLTALCVLESLSYMVGYSDLNSVYNLTNCGQDEGYVGIDNIITLEK